MGDLIVEKAAWLGLEREKSRVPTIVIGPGSRVHGTLACSGL